MGRARDNISDPEMKLKNIQTEAREKNGELLP